MSVTSLAAIALVGLLAAGAECSPVFSDMAGSRTLQPGWTERVSEGNKLTILDDGWVAIDAGEESYAHIQRPLGINNVTVTARLGVCASMFVAWDGDNWCGVGKFTPSPFGKFYSTITREGKTIETDHRGCSFWAPHYLRIQIGTDCIRFSTSSDGERWEWLRTIERPASFQGAPAILAFGKHYPPGMRPFDDGIDVGTSKGTSFHASFGNVTVERTPEKNLHITSAERKELANTVSDRVGHAILSKPEDPTYTSVSKYYPAMKFPREIVGVPEHPLDIGVDYFGRFDVGPWGSPVAWIEIGDQKLPFGEDPIKGFGPDWWRGDVRPKFDGEWIPMKRRLQDGYLPLITLETTREGVQYDLTVFGWSEEFSPERDLHAFFRLKAKGERLPKSISLVSDNGNKRTEIPLSEGAEVCATFKYPEPAAVRQISSAEFDSKAKEVAAFWREKIEPGLMFEIPDTRVAEAYRAWFTYSFLNADRINGFTEIHDGAGFYEEIFGHSMALHIMAMDMWGLHEYAERLLDTQLHFMQPDGNYQQACGLADHGALLMAMSHHYELTKDEGWLERVTPQMVRLCDWLVGKLEDAPKESVTRGLIEFRPYNDYPAPVFNYMGNVVCARGLEMAAEVLKSNPSYASRARRFRHDILVSMEKAAFEHEGMTILDVEPDTNRLLEIGKYRGGDHYGLVVSMLLENDFLDPWDKRTDWYVDILEKREGLVAGLSEFMEGIDHAYTYGYLMTQMKRGDIRKVLLGFWSMMAFGMTRDTYSPVEVSVISNGENHLTLPHSYSLTQQFRLLRNMLVWEDGDTLRIGNAVPREWLKPGRRVAGSACPTLFGHVSFSIESSHDGTMRVRIEPPTRESPKQIIVRLRHPEYLSIASVAGANAEVKDDMLTLKGIAEPTELTVKFGKKTR